MKTTSAIKTIEVMRTLFAAYGLPEQVISDNGPQFTSEVFKHLMKGNHIKHILSTPYHPSTNRLAERFVQAFKKAMRASENSGKPLSYRLVNFLLSYRSTPHATTNRTTSSLFLKRELCTRTDLLRPDTTVRVGERQLSQKVTMVIVLKRESIWLETMLWLETMEMVQSGCPGW